MFINCPNVTIFLLQRPSDGQSGQTDKDFTISRLKTEIRRSEQRVEDLNMEVQNSLHQ